MDDPRGFLQALDSAPDDEPTWSVYADWLEERGDPAAGWLRRLFAVGRGEVPADALEQELKALRKFRSRDATWVDRVFALRARRPMRLRIVSVLHIGDDPPPDMFAYRKTIVGATLEAGTVRVGDPVLLPHDGGEVLATRALNLSDWRGANREAFRFGEKPLTALLMWVGHRPVLRGGLIVPAP